MTNPHAERPSMMPTSYMMEKAATLNRILSGTTDGFIRTASVTARDMRLMVESMLTELDTWGVEPQGAYRAVDPDPQVRRARVAVKPGYESYDADHIARLLPSNYTAQPVPTEGAVDIVGTDVAGWTLDGYVIPRLATALIVAEEVHA